MIIKTDRPSFSKSSDGEQQPIEPVIIQEPIEPKTEPMEPNTGGGGTITQKQMLYTVLAIVVIAVVIVIGVYLYKKYQKSPLTVQ
jgi:hypothetical protein